MPPRVWQTGIDPLDHNEQQDIIRRGLIYVVDVRNGLLVLRYTGRRSREVRRIRFLEGNSNLGDAVRLDRGAGHRRRGE